MAQLDDLKTLLGITGTDEDTILELELSMAEFFIADRRNTYDVTDPDNPVPYVETRFEKIQLQLASEGYSKRGAEGEKGHTEAGIKRTYDSGSRYSMDTVAMITPKVRVIVSEDTEEE